MIPEDRLHCPLRTLSLAGPPLARRRSLRFNKQTIPIRIHTGPKKLCLSPRAIYIQIFFGFLFFESHHFFLLLLSAISSLGRSRR